MSGFFKGIRCAFFGDGNNFNEKRGRAKNGMAFKYATPHEVENCPDDRDVLVVVIKRATDLPYTDSVSLTTNPFCRISVKKSHHEEPDQLQRTFQMYGTVNPVWGETERFLMMVKDDTKLVFSVLCNYGMNKHLAQALGKQKELGDAAFPACNIDETMREYVLPLSKNGSPLEGKLYIDAKRISKEEALNSREEICFEYQRYTSKWGKLFSTDPGRFSNWNNTQFASNFDDVTEELPEGWSVVSPWTTSAQQHGEGWLYAGNMLSNQWYAQSGTTACVRRKTWVRFVARNDYAKIFKAAALEEEQNDEKEENSDPNSKDTDVTSCDDKKACAG